VSRKYTKPFPFPPAKRMDRAGFASAQMHAGVGWPLHNFQDFKPQRVSVCRVDKLNWIILFWNKYYKIYKTQIENLAPNKPSQFQRRKPEYNVLKMK